MGINLQLQDFEVEFLRLALNEAMDNTKNQARYKIYKSLLEKIS